MLLVVFSNDKKNPTQNLKEDCYNRSLMNSEHH